MAESVRVTIVGGGYVGLVSAVCLAARGHRVRILDVRREVVDALGRGRPPIHEAGLPDLLAAVVRDGRLTAAVAGPEAIGDAEVVLVCVGTPSVDGSIDLVHVETASRMIGRWLAMRDDFPAVVVKSTVVPGTTDTFVRGILEAESGRRLSAGEFGLGMNPEFLREGQAVGDFMDADRIVIGHEDPRTLAVLERLYASWGCDKVRVNTRTAEMIKYAGNCLLALQISGMNELANVAAAIGGIDMQDVVRGVTLDRRWSPPDVGGGRVVPGIVSYLSPGCGFGGSCFPKDVQAMRSLAATVGVRPRILQAVLDVNDAQPGAVLEPLERHFEGGLAGRTILLLGLAFKPDTDDVRESASLRIALRLVQVGASVLAHDPVAMPNALAAMGHGVITPVEDWRSGLDAADAVVVATCWPEYAPLADLQARLAGKVVLDARRMFRADQFPHASYLGVGLARPRNDGRNEVGTRSERT